MTRQSTRMALLVLTGTTLLSTGAYDLMSSPASAGTALVSQSSGPDGASTERKARALALRFYEPLNDGRVDALDSVLSKDWVDVPLAPGQAPGRDGFKPIVRYFRSVFPDLHVTHQAVAVSDGGARVTVRSVFTGTQRAEFLGVDPTNTLISFRATDLHLIRNGRIVESWHLEDTFGAYQQMLAAPSTSSG